MEAGRQTTAAEEDTVEYDDCVTYQHVKALESAGIGEIYRERERERERKREREINGQKQRVL